PVISSTSGVSQISKPKNSLPRDVGRPIGSGMQCVSARPPIAGVTRHRPLGAGTWAGRGSVSRGCLQRDGNVEQRRPGNHCPPAATAIILLQTPFAVGAAVTNGAPRPARGGRVIHNQYVFVDSRRRA